MENLLNPISQVLNSKPELHAWMPNRYTPEPYRTTLKTLRTKLYNLQPAHLGIRHCAYC